MKSVFQIVPLFLFCVTGLVTFSSSHQNFDRENNRISEYFQDSLKGTHNNFTSDRNERAFWEVVRIPSSICTFNGGTSSTRQGLCTTKKSCLKDGGTTMGGTSCANGFGVCCLLTATCSANNNGRATIIRNSGTHIQRPSPVNVPQQCQFRIPRRSNVCQIRLDFDNFLLNNPDINGDCRVDTMTITGADNLGRFVLCGNATGRHMYLHFGDSDIISLHLSLNRMASNYDIMVTMVNCPDGRRLGGKGGSSGGRQARRFLNNQNNVDNNNNNNNNNNDNMVEIEAAPFGCTQYYTKATDIVQSFNYQMSLPSASAGVQINNEQYTVCVKTVPGSNRITWQPCPATRNPFFVSGSPPTPLGPFCDTDYVDIPGSERGRYCGNTFPASVSTSAKPYTMYVNFNEYEAFGLDLPVDTISGCCAGLCICLIDGIQSMGCDPAARPESDTCMADPSIANNPLINLLDVGNLGFCLRYTIS